MRFLLALLTSVGSMATVSPALAGETVAQAGDASIGHNVSAGTWTIGASGTTLTLGLDPSRDFEVLGLATASGGSWTLGSSSDLVITVNGRALPFGQRDSGFTYRSAQTIVGSDTLRLDATFDLPASNLRLTRHYGVTSGSPTVEMWATYQSLGPASVTIKNLNAFQLTVPAGTLRWLTGLQGDNADLEHDAAFTRHSKQLTLGEHVAFSAKNRSSERTVPWFAVDSAQEEFYAALMWSGSWSLSVDRSNNSLSLKFGLGSMSTRVGTGKIDGPHALVGVVRGSLGQGAAAIRSYLVQSIRAGRPLTPLVTYNTWYAYGAQIDDRSMREEMARAAAVGAELFVIDAGWYTGAGATGPFDFDTGLGTWEVDAMRFPDGLGPLRDYAHRLGLKFGLWVEPERVSLSTVGRSGAAAAAGADESWLATRAGSYGSDHAAQVCLASDAARQWVIDSLATLIDSVQPDYVKWDNNFSINCDRSGHGHGATDGNFTHVNGLYQVLATLRARYPALLLENVSGGGNRLDLGIARYSDVAWMDDRTAPSEHVRHNVEGLATVFPPAYLLSFVTDQAEEPLHNALDLPLYVRSRMVGVLGLSYRGAALSGDDLAHLASEIAAYKLARDTLSIASGSLLTSQAAMAARGAWDVLQESTSSNSDILIWAFQSGTDTHTYTIKPKALQAEMAYEVRSLDAGFLGTVTGAYLMAYGIHAVPSPVTGAHLFILTAREAR